MNSVGEQDDQIKSKRLWKVM